MGTPAPYPLLLEPILLEKVWGGVRLRGLGKACPEGALIGESWELADLGATSASGAGGQAARSRILNGPLAGKTVHEAVGLWGKRLLGTAKVMPDGGFPLLVKFLDARENLSVQVHPSPAYAAMHPSCHVKTECWYVMDAEAGSLIYKGIRPGITREKFELALRNGSALQHLISVPAVAGECHLLTSGTCHALGAGVLVAEVQTPSDTTFRVFDWGRSGRELHIEQALECIEFSPAPAAARRREGHAWGLLARTRNFDVFEFWSGPAGHRRVRDYHAHRRPTVLTILQGSIRIDGIGAPAGSTILVPVEAAGTLAAEPETKVLVTVIKGTRALAPDLASG